jgi:hypothetical protein
LDYLLNVRQKLFSVNVPAVKKARGRTPLHYSCRNGGLEAAQWLVSSKAQVDPRAKHGVTPFQLAVWQNQVLICQWLVEEMGVNPFQVNDFDCGAVHWLGICPLERANYNAIHNNNDEEEDGRDLLPSAKWLAQQAGIDFCMKQRQGHTPLHKAAWGGHLALLRYLHSEHGLWDDCQDDAGNFAADLADMAHTPRHDRIARYLREECSRARAESCAIMGVPASASRTEIRKAYLEQARNVHPDRQPTTNKADDSEGDHFDALHKAYVHLLEEGGRGNQSNPAHSLHLMLQVSGLQQNADMAKNKDDNVDDSCFKARLIAVLLEYGDKGLDLSNVKKKWKQVWPGEAFPETKKGVSLSEHLVAVAGDVVKLVNDGKGTVRVYAKHCSQAKVAEAAQTSNETSHVELKTVVGAVPA